MKRTIFNAHVERVFDRSKNVIVKKNQEYANEENVFHNFDNSIGISLHDTNVAVAWEFMTKHIQSIKDIVTSVEEDKIKPSITPELLNEKFGDAINYLIFIEAMILNKITKT